MKVVPAILGFALVATGGLAIHLWREVDAGRHRIAGLEMQLQERQAEQAALSATSFPRPAASPPSVQTDDLAARVDLPAQAAAPMPLITLPDIATLQAQMSSPEAMARRAQITRTLMNTAHPDIDEALGLSPQEEDKLLDLLAVHQARSSAVFVSGRPDTDQASARQNVAAALAEHQRTNEAELQNLLGSKYPQWQDYQQTQPAWQQRRDLRAVLDAAGTPLTEAQSQTLIAALSAEQRSFNQTRDAISQPFARNTAERHQRILDAAAPHLSAQQTESYRQMLVRAAAQEQILLAPVREAAAAAAAAAAAGRVP